MVTTTSPNAAQIEHWNEQAGIRWAALQDRIDAQLDPLGRTAIERAALASGERVLDVGCGCGQSTLELAEAVGPRGTITGIDVSSVMLERARQRASARRNVTFECADAQSHPFSPGSFDVVFSRFGVMFFADPIAAFANLREALRPGGRLAFVCWQAATMNAWVRVPMMAAAAHIALPAPPAPGEPGPFAFADHERVRHVLTAAGFADVVVDDHQATLTVGGTTEIDQAVAFLVEIGPVANALRDVAPDANPVVARAIRDALQPFATPAGVRMGAAAWIVSARRPVTRSPG